MAVFLVPDRRGRSLLLLTAADQASARAFAERFLPTSDPAAIGTALTAPQQAAELEWCRMAPM